MSNCVVVPPELRHPKSRLLESSDCMDIDFSPQVVQAFKDFHTILDSSPQVTIPVFRPLADAFAAESGLPKFSNDEVERIICDYLTSHGFDVIVAQIYYTHDRNLSATMKMDYPNVPVNEVTQETKPLLILDNYLSSFDRGDRQWFLTFTRLLRESANALSPGFDRLCRCKKSNQPYEELTVDLNYKTPEKIGPIGWKKGDCGAGFEDLVFGGRLADDQGSRPFFQELQFIERPWIQYPPTKKKGNFIIKEISDDVIADFRNRFEAWKANSSEFPDLKINAQKVIECYSSTLKKLDAFFAEKPSKRKAPPSRQSAMRTKKSESSIPEEDLDYESDSEDSLSAQDRSYELMTADHPHMRK